MKYRAPATECRATLGNRRTLWDSAILHRSFGMWPNTTLDQIARHEAGHAVARAALGVPFSHVQVGAPDGSRVVSGEEGRAEWLPGLPANYSVTDAMAVEFDTQHRGELLAFCVSAAAGPLAQMRFENQEPSEDLEPFVSFGGPGDASLIKQYALILAAAEEDTIHGVVTRKDEFVAEILRDAIALVEREWEWIERVAVTLEGRGKLSWAEVADLRVAPLN